MNGFQVYGWAGCNLKRVIHSHAKRSFFRFGLACFMGEDSILLLIMDIRETVEDFY